MMPIATRQRTSGASRSSSLIAQSPPLLPPFVPPLWLHGGHAQTLWANYAERATNTEPLVEGATVIHVRVEDGDELRVHWTQSPKKNAAAPPARSDVASGHPVLLLLHGLTGCAGSPGLTALGAKALDRGFDVVRVDLRNAFGDTPSVGVGHAGRSEDFRAALDHIGLVAPGRPVCAIGQSMGGNIALKAAGEYGHAAPPQLRAVVGISVPIDLDAASTLIDRRSNWPYRRYFLRRLEQIFAIRSGLNPEIYRGVQYRGMRTLREFDNAVVAGICDFADADDYYRRSSSVRTIDQVRVPTLLIQSRDDPFVPFASYGDPRVRNNPCVTLASTPRGGHVGFYARSAADDVDRYWAENRALDFCASSLCGASPS